MTDASELAATLRQLHAMPSPYQGELGYYRPATQLAIGRPFALDLATALERGERSALFHVEGVERFVALTTALMRSIADGEPQFVQLELIGNACNACDCVDDESIALYERAKAVAAVSARDRERGAAAEAFLAAHRRRLAEYDLWRDGLASLDGWEAATQAQADALAAYDALTEAPDV